jgi:hypothetical protein
MLGIENSTENCAMVMRRENRRNGEMPHEASGIWPEEETDEVEAMRGYPIP